MNVIVFGSINIDLVTRIHRLPNPGETLAGQSFFTASGGKGANQAVATARLGIPTTIVGRVGNDNFGEQLIAGLQASGVNCDRVLVDAAIASGVAAIAVDDRGENTIVIVAGANGEINESDCDRFADLLPDADVLLLQLEIPLPAVKAAAEKARAAGVTTILDPAPARELPAELYRTIDIITPNETEAKILTGIPVNDEKTAREAAAELRRRGVETAIVKLGAKGVVCASAVESFFIPAFPVNAVDTVAAGDAFNGALAAAIASGLSLREAAIWGAAAGALCATKSGAQPSLCDRSTFDSFLREQGIGNREQGRVGEG